MKIVPVPISVFASCMGYCQFRIINEFHLKLKAAVTTAQTNGIKVHETLEKEDLEIPRTKTSKKELLDRKVDLDIPRETIMVGINRDKFLYLGRLDHVKRIGGDIYIIDDKTTKTIRPVYPSTKLQLAAYCEGFNLMFSNVISFRKLFFQVVQRNPKGEIMTQADGEYTNNIRDFLIDNFNTFEGIFNQKIPPTHHNNVAKCNGCSFDCGWRLK